MINPFHKISALIWCIYSIIAQNTYINNEFRCFSQIFVNANSCDIGKYQFVHCPQTEADIVKSIAMIIAFNDVAQQL